MFMIYDLLFPNREPLLGYLYMLAFFGGTMYVSVRTVSWNGHLPKLQRRISKDFQPVARNASTTNLAMTHLINRNHDTKKKCQTSISKSATA